MSKPDPTQARKLQPVHIPKPWGQEIWYTGMEERGESAVYIDGESLPLSQYLASDPAAICGERDVLLLKILDPRPEPVLGDLYFEVHEEKEEVYVVTAVDEQAWPTGSGAIRYGLNQARRAAFEDDRDFRAAYLSAVRAYEGIRRTLDGETPERPLPTVEEEAEARERMEAFTELKTLKVGDVVHVPTWAPHALQHGVRVVEFQTPTYERLIVSFAQAVVTQPHWDSERAIASMSLDIPKSTPPEPVVPGVERIASYETFNAWRADLDQCAPLILPQHLPYAVGIAVTGECQAGSVNLAPEEACFIPGAALADTRIEGHGIFLIAAPDL